MNLELNNILNEVARLTGPAAMAARALPLLTWSATASAKTPTEIPSG